MNKQKKKNIDVYLLGGFFRNANYGDVIQALVWYEWYKQKGYSLSLIFDESNSDKSIFKHFFPDVKLIDFQKILNPKMTIPLSSILHVYGGGYLNQAWGDTFIEIISKFNCSKSEIIITGVQIDNFIRKKFTQIIPPRVNIHWVSVRDSISQKYARSYNTEPILCDDSFIYFVNHKRLKVNDIQRNTKSQNFLVHLNLSRRVISQVYPSRSFKSLFYTEHCFKADFNNIQVALATTLNNLIQCKNLAPIFINNFYKISKEEPEGSNLGNYPVFKQIIRSYPSVSTFNIKGGDYCFGIANSYHIAVFMSLCLDIPVIFISLNGYYEQKIRSLIYANIVSSAAVIRKISEINKIPSLVSNLSNNPDRITIKSSALSVLQITENIINNIK